MPNRFRERTSIPTPPSCGRDGLSTMSSDGAALGRGLPDLPIRFRWPGQGPSSECDNFFLGVWHPRRRIQVEWVGTPSAPHVSRRGPNWLLASAASPVTPPGPDLYTRGRTAPVPRSGATLF